MDRKMEPRFGNLDWSLAREQLSPERYRALVDVVMGAVLAGVTAGPDDLVHFGWDSPDAPAGQVHVWVSFAMLPEGGTLH